MISIGATPRVIADITAFGNSSPGLDHARISCLAFRAVIQVKSLVNRLQSSHCISSYKVNRNTNLLNHTQLTHPDARTAVPRSVGEARGVEEAPNFPTTLSDQVSAASVYTWLQTPLTSRAAFPGLGWATVAFAAYVIYDDFFRVKTGHH